MGPTTNVDAYSTGMEDGTLINVASSAATYEAQQPTQEKQKDFGAFCPHLSWQQNLGVHLRDDVLRASICLSGSHHSICNRDLLAQQ